MKCHTQYTMRIVSSALMACVATLVLLWLLAGGLSALAAPVKAPASELKVCPSGCAYSSIQEAVDAADHGDVIKVAQGEYTDVHHIASLSTGSFTATQIVAITRSITLRGGYNDDFTTWDPEIHHTILDAREQGRVVVVSGAGINPTIEGLHITGGDSSGLGGSVYDYDGGGGIYVLYSSAVISGNQIYSNTAYRGAGVWLQDCTATFRSNNVRDNTAGWAGAGMWLYRSPSILQGNHVVSNAAIFAGGMALHLSDATLSGNAILSNTASSSEGGGVMLISSQATLDGNLICANRTDEAGGGLCIFDSDALLTNNVIADNYAQRLGSGIHVQGSAPRLVHTTIARNGGGGGGLYAVTSTLGLVSDVIMTNTIIYSHTEGIIAESGNTVTLHATLWHANDTGWIGAGAISHTRDYSGDPAFDADGYHLTGASAAIDKGVGAGATADIDGDTRPAGISPDLGADEFIPVALTRVSVDGPNEGLIDRSYIFTATVSPLTATTPIAYTWVPTPAGKQGANVAVYSWSAPGTKTITITVENVAGAAPSGVHTIYIQAYKVYLPLVVRGG